MKRDRTIGFFQSLKEKTTEDYHSWWIKFLDIIFHLPYSKTSFDQCIVQLQMYYEGNQSTLNDIELFVNTYNGQKAAYWYTRNSFVYRLVNDALRRWNVEIIFLMGFFLQDLYRQVTEEYGKQKLEHFNQSILKLFRGQKMGESEWTSVWHSLK